MVELIDDSRMLFGEKIFNKNYNTKNIFTQ